MPVQKGKKRRRVRNRGPLVERSAIVPQSSAKPVAKPAQRRRGWNVPPWLNALFGVAMLVAGAFLFVYPQKGMGTQSKILLLATYVLVAAFYLFRAYRGYRSRSS